MKLSIVIPVYESAQILEQGYFFILKILKNITQDYEILYRNDGSSDNSQEVLNKLCSQDKNVRIFSNKKNKGLGFTLRSLFKDAKGEYIIYLDADSYQCFDLSLIERFIKEMKENDVIIASRYEVATRQIPFYRVYPSRVYYWINKVLFGISIKDIGSGFVVFKKKALNIVNLNSDGFDIHIEIFAKLHKAGFRIKEIPVNYTHWYGGSFNVFKHGPKTLLNTIKLFFSIKVFNRKQDLINNINQ